MPYSRRTNRSAGAALLCSKHAHPRSRGTARPLDQRAVVLRLAARQAVRGDAVHEERARPAPRDGRDEGETPPARAAPPSRGVPRGQLPKGAILQLDRPLAIRPRTHPGCLHVFSLRERVYKICLSSRPDRACNHASSRSRSLVWFALAMPVCRVALRHARTMEL